MCVSEEQRVNSRGTFTLTYEGSMPKLQFNESNIKELPQERIDKYIEMGFVYYDEDEDVYKVKEEFAGMFPK